MGGIYDSLSDTTAVKSKFIVIGFRDFRKINTTDRTIFHLLLTIQVQMFIFQTHLSTLQVANSI